jgi:hypothetical protein
MNISKSLWMAAAAAIVLAAPRPVQAYDFTLDSYVVSLHTSDPGLVLWEKDLLDDPATFPSLNNVGDWYRTKLFQIGTDETALNLDDLKPYSIEVSFNFSQPKPGFGGDARGLTGAGWFGDSFGYLAWDNPFEVSFGRTGVLGISLSNETFDLPGSADVYATFTLLHMDSPSPIPNPEPASLLLVGSAMAIAVRRFRRRA